MDKNNFDFDKTFNDLFKIAKQQFKDVDEHLIKVSIYGYIYTELLGEDFENKDNEDYLRAKKQYNIMEYDNEVTLISKSCDIKGDFDIDKFCKLNI
jgi:hypothetical protein